MTTLEIRETLKELKGNGTLYKRVINDIISESNNYDGSLQERLNGYLKDVTYGGCVSGIVSMMVYYDDTVKFYNRYKQQIEDLALEFEFSIEKDDLRMYKNNMAWFAYETIANDVSTSIE